MQGRTAYLNGFTKRQEIDFNMGSLRHNLKNMQVMNKSSIELDKVSINKNKTKYLVNRRTHEIDLENSILAKKIKDIIFSRDKSKYHSHNEKYSKSLNGFVKKDAQRKIDHENSKLVDRLQVKKPTYQTKKLMKEWTETQYLEKKVSKFDFHIGESPVLCNKSKLRRNSSITADSNEYSFKTEMFLGGAKWEIKVYEAPNEIKIVGEHCLPNKQAQKDRQVKLISVPIEEAKSLLKKHCNGRLKDITKLLAVDQRDHSLMLITPSEKKPDIANSINPEEKGFNNYMKKMSPSVRQPRNSQPPRHLLLQDVERFSKNTNPVAENKSVPVSSRHHKLEPIQSTAKKSEPKEEQKPEQGSAQEKNEILLPQEELKKPSDLQRPKESQPKEEAGRKNIAPEPEHIKKVENIQQIPAKEQKEEVLKSENNQPNKSLSEKQDQLKNENPNDIEQQKQIEKQKPSSQKADEAKGSGKQQAEIEEVKIEKEGSEESYRQEGYEEEQVKELEDQIKEDKQEQSKGLQKEEVKEQIEE